MVGSVRGPGDLGSRAVATGPSQKESLLLTSLSGPGLAGQSRVDFKSGVASEKDTTLGILVLVCGFDTQLFQLSTVGTHRHLEAMAYSESKSQALESSNGKTEGFSKTQGVRTTRILSI